MKTTLRYILIVIGLASVLSVGAQGLATKPEAQMRSTSVMVGAGSTLPQAASTGTYVTGTTVGTYTPAKVPPGHIRKGLDDDDEGEVTVPDDHNDPDPTPIGDALLPLMVMAMGFGGVIYLRRKRA